MIVLLGYVWMGGWRGDLKLSINSSGVWPIMPVCAWFVSLLQGATGVRVRHQHL